MTTVLNQVSPYKGYIDWVSSGFIRGWVYDPEHPNSSVKFKLLLDGVEVLQSTADMYREDLVKAGFGNGAHGYCVPNQWALNFLLGKTLKLVDINNKQIGKVLVIRSELEANVNVVNFSSDHYALTFEVNSNEALNATFQLFNKNERFWQGNKKLKIGKNHLEFPVSLEMINNKEHEVTLGILGKFKPLWQESLLIKSDSLANELYISSKNIDGKPTIVMIDRSTPKPDMDAGSYAAIKEISLLQNLGYHIVFIPDDFVYSPKYTEKLHKMGVELVHAPYYSSTFDVLTSFLKNASAVYITRYYLVEKYISSIKYFSKTLPIIFNSADLHFLREIRQANITNDKALLASAIKTRAREVKVMESVDVILSYSEYEHAVITSHTLRSDNVYKCPWVVDIPEEKYGFDEREGVAFLGGYEHKPNIDAVVFFIEQVMPLLRKKNNKIKLYIYGSHMPDSFQQYACDDVVLVGYVKSLDEVYTQHRVFIAPLRYGAGVKGKVLASAAYGLPCVLSPVAIEATGLVHNVSALVANNNNQWSEYVSQLYTNKKKWDFLSENQRIMIKDSYSFDKSISMMENILSSIDL